jgi:membrane-associated phospholipid phosphatase
VIVELKNFYKRPRPFRVDSKLNDPMLKSTEGFAYPSGHSTQSNLIYLVLSYKYPKLESDLNKIKDDIVYSRQMAKAHYPTDIKFGEKLAKSLFDYLKKEKLIS